MLVSSLLLLLLTIFKPCYCGPVPELPSHLRPVPPEPKICEEKVCEPYQYCSTVEHECKSCEDVCNPDSNDHRSDICEKQCQDFVYERVFGKVHQVERTVNNIYWLLIVILILLILVIVMIGGLVYRKVRRHVIHKLRKLERDKIKEKQITSVAYTTANNNNTVMDGSIRCISQGIASTMPSTMTLTTQTESPCSTNKSCAGKTLPLSSEEPSEDTTLDYASYINQGMTHSPSNENGLNTTSKY